MSTKRWCEQCSHNWDNHILEATEFAEMFQHTVPQGGTISCPEEGCDCHMTWSLGVPVEET